MVAAMMASMKSSCAYGLGYVHEEPGADCPTTLQLFGATRPDLLPKDASLYGFVTAIFDQGPTMSCVANAISTAVGIRFRKLGFERERPSRKALYDGARIYAKKDPGDEMVDEGSSAILALQCMADEGVPTEADAPLDPATINDEIDFQTLKQGTTCFISGWWQMPQQGPARADAIAHSVAKGYPVIFALSVDQGFEQCQRGTTIDSLEPDTGKEGNKSLGWHMVACVGYRTRPDGAREFQIVNSWGTGWADGGTCWMHEAVISSDDKRRVKAFYVMEVLP